MFSEDQLERLRSFPEISRDELIRYFTPATGDVAFVDTGRGRGGRTGWACLSRCARCRGWGSCLMRCARRRPRPWTGWRIAWAARADPFGSSGKGRGAPAVEDRPGWRQCDEGAGAVPPRPGDGARLADAAVQPGARVPGVGEGDAIRMRVAARDPAARSCTWDGRSKGSGRPMGAAQ
jgi:hypothetical protein